MSVVPAERAPPPSPPPLPDRTEHGHAAVALHPHCQYCGSALSTTWADLGLQPLANEYRADMASARTEAVYPLHARFCATCYLVQVDRVVTREAIFSDYAYFSSYSASWLDHCERGVADLIARFGLTDTSRIVEIASNDGYLLQYFARAGMTVLGIEPAANVAAAARAAGIPTEVAFFGAETAAALVRRGVGADHLIANNVLAHVPDIADFLRGVAVMLVGEAVFTAEFPHILRTIRGMQFDQIYHEHFSYLSLLALKGMLEAVGLRIFDVEEVATHGGSLRLHACRHDAGHVTRASVARILRAELAARLDTPAGYTGFEHGLQRIRTEFLAFVADCRARGAGIAGYGAAAKANTFLNYCRADAAMLPFIADRSDAKVGRFMPGSGIPILDVDAIRAARPAFVLILPWNLRDEIMDQLAFVRNWGGRFVTAVPAIRIV